MSGLSQTETWCVECELPAFPLQSVANLLQTNESAPPHANPRTDLDINRDPRHLHRLLRRLGHAIRRSRVRPGVLVRALSVGPVGQTRRLELRPGLRGQHERNLRWQPAPHLVQPDEEQLGRRGGGEQE